MVKITAIRNWIKDGGNIEDLGIEVKQYLPINDKEKLVSRVIIAPTIEEDGIKKIDAVTKRFFYEIEMVRAYSNLDFSTIDKYLQTDGGKYSEKLVEYYDMIKSSGLVDNILGMIDTEEVRFINDCIEEQIVENNRINNSIAGVVGSALNKLVDKLPDEEGMKELVQGFFTGLKDVNPDNLKMLATAIGWNNGIDVPADGE